MHKPAGQCDHNGNRQRAGPAWWMPRRQCSTLAGGTNATLTLTSTDYGSAHFVGLTVLNGRFRPTTLQASATYRDAGTDIVARINGQTASGKGLTASIATSLLRCLVTFATAYNAASVDSKITITGAGRSSRSVRTSRPPARSAWDQLDEYRDPGRLGR